jgi:hypothetical protein
MKPFWVLVTVFAFLGFLPGAAALDREAFTVTHYDLAVRLEPEQQRLGVRGRITLRNDSAQPQHLAALQISSSLSWRSIRAVSEPKSPPQSSSGQSSSRQSLSLSQADSPDAGQPLQFVSQPYTSDTDHTGELSEAIVTLPRELAPNESIDLAIGYEGVIVLDTTRLTRIGTPEAVARHSDWDQIGKDFTAVRSVGYVTWYPVAMEAQGLADGSTMFAALGKWKARHAASSMDLQVALVSSGAHEPMTLLVNARNCAITEEAMGVNETLLSDCKYDALGFANPTLVAGNLKQSVAGPVRLHYLAEHASAAEEFTQTVERAAYLVQDWFGAPRDTLDVVDLSDPGAAPFEARNWLLLPLAKSDPQMEYALVVHQLTHAALPSPRLWIYEGAAHFAQALVREKDGREAALDSLSPHRAAVAQAETQAGGAGEALATASAEVLYRSKAALVWWMLRDMVGDAALKRALHAYQAGEDKDSAYLQRLVEVESKRDLGWFFHDWVYTDAGLPDFRMESANARLTTSTNFVTAVTVTNSGSAGAEVPVTIHTDAGDFTQRLEVRGKAKAVTRIATPSEPIEVIVNDGSVPESGVTEHRLKIVKDEGK